MHCSPFALRAQHWSHKGTTFLTRLRFAKSVWSIIIVGYSLIKFNMARKLSTNTINKFKKKLLAEKEQLTQILEHHQQERENIRLSEASAERSPDPTSADGGSMAFELEKELTLDENTRHLLNQVEHALVLIKKKKYGNCENCGEPIPVARLEALPYSSLCKNCAALIES